MFSKPIEALIANSGALAITEAFIVLMLAAFIYAAYAKRMDKSPAFCNYTPTLLTSLGILGTFCGIVAGLLGFNIGDIDGSIDMLLQGMKTAFTTSLVGMGLSIIFKSLIASGLLNPPQQEEDLPSEEQIGIEDLYQVMREQRDGVLALQSSIAGEHQSSLNGQLQALRAESKHNIQAAQKETKHQQVAFQAFQKNLWLKLDKFALNLSQAAAEQMAKAQQTVIRDFNQNFSEQFGGNFSRLNSAVQEMVEWQNNYRDQLADMRSNYDQGVQAISQTESALANINEQTQQIGVNLGNWQSIMEVNQHQIQELERHLEAFAHMRDEAAQAVPDMQQHIKDTLAGVQQASEQMGKGVQESSEQMKQSLAEGAKSMEECLQNNSERLHTALQESAEKISDSGKALQDSGHALRESSEAQRDTLQQTLKDGQEQLMHAFGESSQALNKAAEAISQSQIDNNKLLQELAQNIREQSDGHYEALQSSQEKLQQQFEELGKDIGLESQEFAEQIRESGNALMRVAGRSREAFDNDMQSMVESVSDSMQQMSAQHAEESLKIVELHIKLTQDLHRILTHAN
ncbi:hypothetical protein [Pseudoteredinibacter isoporae]|uniref:hypothetical protein n=1 Tax=Pseudoteredinibacter isoporae TaxID=570281 RepID=UPI00310C187E